GERNAAQVAVAIRAAETWPVARLESHRRSQRERRGRLPIPTQPGEIDLLGRRSPAPAHDGLAVTGRALRPDQGEGTPCQAERGSQHEAARACRLYTCGKKYDRPGGQDDMQAR